MSTITKERLEPVIERLEHYATNVKWTNVQAAKDMLIAVDAMRRLLASLEAEPVSVFKIDHESSLIKHVKKVVSETNAPPAPVALPSGYSDFEEIWSSSTHPLTQDDEMKDFAWDIWNACRAAMLQGADGALTNEDTKRVGELVMWVKRLAHSLRKANPDSKLQSDAMDYLSRKGLIGVKDILR
ncbi:hypothetical protein UXP39_20705 [Enterobacter sichuanensis]|uniref:hypothetical protein n=1 Tax=Enterobacter sichuanensis TaxID=2071710 RepID=UPI002FCF9FEC